MTSPVTVGRQRESERLDRSIAALSEGQARLVVLSGEAGIGKTRLIDDCLSRAGTAVRVLRGDCLALGQRIPYLPFAELLRDFVRQGPAHRVSSIIRPARAELARILPELATNATSDDDATAPPRRADELERLRLYEAFIRVTERIAADQPTVFVIEDVQWIDAASLELLAFMAHALPSSPAMLVVSVRPEEVEDKPAALTLLAELGRGASVERIELGPLDPDAVRHLATEIRGQPPADALVERIVALSDGNPLFTEELLAASLGGMPDETLPPRLRDLLAARLAAVPGEVLEVLRVAAAAGPTIDDQLLAQASGLPETQVERAVRAAVEGHILVRPPGAPGSGYRFRHEILRSLVASQLLPAESRRIHAACAQALAAARPEPAIVTQIAHHWDAASESERALTAHVEAGALALQAFAYGQAHAHYERAMELWDRVEDIAELVSESRVEITVHAAGAAAKAGDLDRAIELTRALCHDRDQVDAETFEVARSSLRWYLWESGDLAGARAEAEAAITDAAVMPPRWYANALAHLAGVLLLEQRTSEAGQRAGEARDAASEAGALEERIMAEGVLGTCLLLEGDIEAGLAALRSVLEATQETEDRGLVGRYPVGTALAHWHLARALELVGSYEETYSVAVGGVEIADRQGVARTFGSLLQAQAARALYQLGRWTEASTSVDEALRAGAVGAGRTSLLTVRALLAVGRGDQETAKQTMAEAEDAVDAGTSLDVRRWLTAAIAEQALWQGDPTTALTGLALLAEEPRPAAVVTPGAQPAILDASIPHLLALGARASADVALRERAEGAEPGLSRMAEEQLRASLRRVQRRGALAVAWAGDLATAKAELSRASGDASGSVRRWELAVEQTVGRPYAACYARWRLAEAQLSRRTGREREAAAPVVEAALAAAESLGATPIRNELLGLARRARLTVTSESEGSAVSASDDQRPFGLTAREAEVLVLLADGLSNQEIAERLYISPKTASVHVSNIYGKLGVESRVAAATTAQSLGLVGTPGETGESVSSRVEG